MMVGALANFEGEGREEVKLVMILMEGWTVEWGGWVGLRFLFGAKDGHGTVA